MGSVKSSNRTSGKKTITSALIWKCCERFGVSGAQFVLQIILARILGANLYGVLGIMIVFTQLANVFIQRGFNTALIQNKEVIEEDYSSVLWVSTGIAGIIYVILFFSAPWIAAFYDMPEIVEPLRVLSLMLFPGALNSIQIAKTSRDMDFRKTFYGNVAGIILGGVVGIVIAYNGGGLWALVAQTLLNTLTACIVMRALVKIKFRFAINWKRVKMLFAYGWKLLVSGLLDTLYQDIRSLVIGKKYDSSVLGYYDRGKHFPQFLINAINMTVQAVMLPAMSEKQDEKDKVRALMRNSMVLSAYIIFPMMAGLAAVATPLIELLLTEKWLPCVPYMQVYCFTLAFYPVHSCNLQAINAMGRSDLFLKLEVIKKSYGLVALIIAVVCFDSPLAIALTGTITTLIGCFVNAGPNKKLLGYSYLQQMVDIMPSFFISIVMFFAVWTLQLLPLGNLPLLLIQIVCGVGVYLALSAVFRIKPFMMVLEMIKKRRKKAA